MTDLTLSIAGQPPAAANRAASARADAVIPWSLANWRGLYAHVPFCRHKCHYCDFYSFVDREDRGAAYVDRLAAECSALRGHVSTPLETIFVGGGTPTMLPPGELERALSALASLAQLGLGGEFTVEANPETVTDAIAGVLVGCGVNRVSIGCQSFQPSLLTTLERHHDPASVGRAVGILRRAGITNINLDLIFAVPTSRLEQWHDDLDRAVALEPEHISCYGLVYEPNTPLATRLARGEVQRIDEVLEGRMYEHARAVLAAHGYQHYEISNWARPGRRCQHNLLYWRNADWLALGPSASGHSAGVRWKNVPRLSDWLSSSPWTLVQDVECLDAEASAGEQFMLGLRLIDGLDKADLERLLAMPGGARRRAVIERLCRGGLLLSDAAGLRIVPSKLMVADSVISELL